MKIVGIDLGVHKVALAYLEDDQLLDTIYAGDSLEGVERDLALRELAGLAQAWVTVHEADWVWVEEPLVGNNHKYSLAIAEVKGAVLSHLAQVRMQFGTDIRTVNVGEWKKTVVGKGNATKAEVKNYIDVTHPQYAPLCDGDQDRYDATCIALYGREILQRARNLRLTDDVPAG